jgi:hypothetical protein
MDQPPQQQVVVMAAPGTPGLGVAGFVIGLISLLIALIPIIGAISWPGSVLAIIFSGVGMNQATKRHASKGLAIAGLVLGIIALFLAIISVSIISSATK